MEGPDKGKVKESVRRRYGSLARRATGPEEREAPSCCAQAPGTPECRSGGAQDPVEAFVGLYTDDEVAGLPDTVIGASAGCGNPTALADLRPGETVLDLGSGGGVDVFLAARAVGPAGLAMGLDMTPEMIGLARSNAQRIGATNTRFILGEMEDMPVESGSVDVIISNCVINLSPDKEAVFREAFRVLKPGGRIFISDIVSRGKVPQEVRNNPEEWPACTAGAEDREDYLALIRDAGFTDVSILEEKHWHAGEGWADSLYSLSVRAHKPGV